eukprot:Phypoly_transcript_05329.p1 GENE.Phypoly_transcript_05329~~Phypoly_transcript_05329.p1  ORF type:complete len:596 (+),score=91.59 Phypoly_transcript_05329:72-1859(+)
MYLSKLHHNKIQVYKSFFVQDKPNERRGTDEVKRRRTNDADESSPFITPPHSPPESPDAVKEGLKIKIKIQPNPQAVPPRVGLLPFEPLLELRDSLRNYTHNTGDWSDGMLAGLRTQLEGAKATIVYLAQEVSQHSQVLDAWKPPQHEDKPRNVDSTEKKGKKKRMHDEFKLAHRVPVYKPTWFPYSNRAFTTNENDSSYSSCSSAEEEVDVDGDEAVEVDVDTLDGEDQNADAEEAAKEEEYTPVKVKRRGGGGAVGGGRDRMAQMIIRRHREGKPSSAVRRQKYKNLANANAAPAAPPRRAKSEIPPATSPTDYDAGVAGAGGGVSSSESEEEMAPVPLGPSAFWTAMEPYLRAPTDQDLAYITPKPPRADDSIFTIPALGVHYLQVWASGDGIGSPPIRHSSRVMPRGEGLEGVEYTNDDDEAPDPIMGDITQRILQSLIDEHIILNRPPSPFPDESPMSTDENKENTSSSSIPAIPVNIYSRAQMVALEDRIRLELRAIGLLDDEELDPADREDDEVCAELRLNQNLLREQIAINNDRRLRLLDLIKPKMREHEEMRKQKFVNLAIEKNYQKLVQKKKKRGGRRAPPPQVI